MATKNAISNKSQDLTVDPGASGDSYIQFNINTTGEFRIGVDDDDSDAFKVSQGSALGSNDALRVSAGGEITHSLQPAFLATGSTQSNVTGDATAYTVTFSSAEHFDQNNDFDGTSTFTAPVTGIYQFNCELVLDDLTSSHTVNTINLSTSNRDYVVGYFSPGAVKDVGDRSPSGFSLLVDMDSADTAVVKLTVSNGTKVVDIVSSWFNGYLAC